MNKLKHEGNKIKLTVLIIRMSRIEENQEPSLHKWRQGDLLVKINKLLYTSNVITNNHQ